MRYPHVEAGIEVGEPASNADGKGRKVASRGLLGLACIIVILGAGQMLHGAVSTGYTWDEHTHVQRLQNWFDSGWYLPNWEMDDVAEPAQHPTQRQSVYGPSFALIAHGLNVMVGHEAFGELASTAEANDVRHLTVSLLGLVTAVAVGAIGWLLTRSAIAAAWSTAALLSLPRWVGHSMFNPKDIPVAAGYTLATLALVIGVAAWTRGQSRFGTGVLAGLSMFAGVVIGVGTRTGMWVLLALSVVSYGLLRLVQAWRRRVPRLLREDVGILAGGLVGLACVFLLSPRVARTPFWWFYRSIRGSSDFQHSGSTLTAGQLLETTPPWWYLPAWIGATTPLLIGIVIVAGMTAIVARVVSRVPGEPPNDTTDHRPFNRAEFGWLLVMQQALLGPTAAIVLQAAIYNGLRQHIYVLPALAALSGYGAWWLLGRAGSRSKAAVIGTVTVLAVALAAPTIDQLRLHPFQYVYVNEIAGPVDGRWTGDYWLVAAREAIQRIPAEEEVRCGWRRGGCYRGVGPYSVEQGTHPTEANIHANEIWFIGRTANRHRVPDGCREVDNVTRPLRSHEVTIAYVLACSQEFDESS